MIFLQKKRNRNWLEITETKEIKEIKEINSKIRNPVHIFRVIYAFDI